MNSVVTDCPDPLVVCASRPPRLVFVGVTDRLLEIRDLKGGRPGMIGVDFWASLPSAVRLPSTHSAGGRSCLGLCLFQVCGRDAAHPSGHDTASDHQSPEPPRRLTATWRTPIRSWVCGEPSRTRMRDRRAARRSLILPTEHAVSVPPALQRFDEADALPVLPNHATRLDRLPV